MNEFCMPVITTKKITDSEQSALATAITSSCTNRQEQPDRRRMMKTNLKPKLSNLKKKEDSVLKEDVDASAGESKEIDDNSVEMRRNMKSEIGNIEAEVVDDESEVDSVTVE